MKKHLLIVGIIFLFLSSVVVPMTTGINTDTSEVDVDPLRDYYGCYNLREIPESIRPIISEDEENQNNHENENIRKKTLKKWNRLNKFLIIPLYSP